MRHVGVTCSSMTSGAASKVFHTPKATALDILRLLAREGKSGKKRHDHRRLGAFDHINVGHEQPWLAAGARLVQYYGAATSRS